MRTRAQTLHHVSIPSCFLPSLPRYPRVRVKGVVPREHYGQLVVAHVGAIEEQCLPQIGRHRPGPVEPSMLGPCHGVDQYVVRDSPCRECNLISTAPILARVVTALAINFAVQECLRRYRPREPAEESCGEAPHFIKQSLPSVSGTSPATRARGCWGCPVFEDSIEKPL